VVVAAVTALVVPATGASAGGGYGGHGREEIRTVAEGLDGPRQLNDYKGHKLVVAESDSGEVSSVDLRSGRVRTLLSGLPTPQGVDYDRGRLYVALGESAPDSPSAPTAAPSDVAGSSVIVARPNGRILRTYDLLDYELENNPDGQRQFDQKTGEPLDALSNPFAVHVQKHRILVADAGANAVLSIDRRTHRISTFFVPPVVPSSRVPGCAGANEAQGIDGCDPVPTGVTTGRNGLVYVSTLGAEVEGAARVYVLDKRGKVVRVIKHLTGLTGIAVDRRGTVYVSELLEGAPEGEGPPPADFDASTVGQVVRIDRHDHRSYAQVTMPTGLEFHDGRLYASAWSVAAFLGMPGAGEVVQVGSRAFHRKGR
jgi:hypothetical protein